jgi:tetratricopeptide (TPR) repeat protein
VSAALVLGMLLTVAPVTASAAVSVRARVEPAQVRVGDSADLSIEIQGAQNAPAPALAAPDGLTIHYVGPSTQVSFVNGQVSASVTHRYGVVATRPGSFTIGPIAVEVEGRRYDAGSVTLAVAAAGAPAGGQGAQPAGEQLRLVLSAPRSEVYLHQRLPLSLKLYVGNVRVTDLQYPAIPGDGFSLDKLPEPEQRREQTPSGVFQVVEFRTTLVPLRSGALGVGPATMRLGLVVRGRSRDPFFGTFLESSRPTELRSEPLDLTVLPLPEADRPAGFSGGVGRFAFEVTAAPLELTAGDPVTVTSTIRGEGNLESVTPPGIAASDALRVYPVQPLGPAAAGERRFEQVVIPQRAGALAIPELVFSYFDPEARAYQTVVRPPIPLTVHASAEPHSPPQMVGAAEPARPEALGQDIVFIKDEPGSFRPLGARRHRSAVFWGLMTLPPALWAVAAVYDRRRRRLTGDMRYARYTRAGRAARQAIAGARAALQVGDRARFYDTIARAMGDYLSAKLDLPAGAVTAHTAAERLRASPLSSEITRDLEEFFATCERARFAPAGDGGADMARTLARAEGIVRTLERTRRLARPMAALWLLVLAGLASAAPPIESPNGIFFRANGLYGEERYAAAAAEYERVLAAGLESCNLYFNLGNAYFKAGDVARARLNYERARRLIPRDPDLHANLGYASAQIGGEEDEPPVWARLFFPFAERLSSDELWLAVAAAWTVLMLLLAGGRLVAAAQRVTRGGALAAAIALGVLLASAAYRLWSVDLPRHAVVVAGAETSVRFEPSPTGTVHFPAKPGSLLRVLAERDQWAQVARRDGRRGWVERSVLAPM